MKAGQQVQRLPARVDSQLKTVTTGMDKVRLHHVADRLDVVRGRGRASAINELA